MKVLPSPAFQMAIDTDLSSNHTSTRLIPTAPRIPHNTPAARVALITKLMH